MDENNEQKNSIAEVVAVDITTKTLEETGYQATPVGELLSLGAAGSAFQNFLDSAAVPGGEGLYKVTFPEGVDGVMQKFKNEDAYLGAIRSEDGLVGQARLRPVQYDPTQMLMMLVLVDIEHKLQTIIATQQEILHFIHAVEEAKIQGNLTTLNTAIEDFKYNWDNETFVENNLSLVSGIIKDSNQSKALYLKLIQETLNTPNLPHTVRSANEKINKLISNMQNYHLAFYLDEYATLFETLLQRNFSEAYLANVKKRMESEQKEYDNLQNECKEWITKYYKSAIDHVAAPALKNIDKAVGKVAKKLPGDLDTIYKNDEQYYLSSKEQNKKLKSVTSKDLKAFPQAIGEIKNLQKQLPDFYIDGDVIYLPSTKKKGKIG